MTVAYTTSRGVTGWWSLPTHRFPRSRLALQVALSASLLTSLALGMLLLLAASFRPEVLREAEFAIGAGDDVVLVHQLWSDGLGPDAACDAFEMRWPSSIGTRHRAVSYRIRSDALWVAEVDGGVLTILVGGDLRCTFQVEAEHRRLAPIDDQRCEGLVA